MKRNKSFKAQLLGVCQLFDDRFLGMSLSLKARASPGPIAGPSDCGEPPSTAVFSWAESVLDVFRWVLLGVLEVFGTVLSEYQCLRLRCCTDLSQLEALLEALLEESLE